jgi:peptidylprolyl isomerase
MILRLLFVISVLFSLLIGCQKKDKIHTDIEVTSTQKKTSKKPKQKRRKDSLNHKNVVAFLTEYGKQNKETLVKFKTRLGDFTIKLYEDTPLHRASFIFLTKIGYFNTTCFHRVVPDFIAQGGNSESVETVGIRNRYKNYRLPAEFRTNRKHKRSAIAAARDWEDNPEKKSTPFEFYIIQSKKGSHHLNGEHTVFGEIIKGMKVVDKITVEKTDRDEWPYTDVYIEAEILK